MNISQSTSSSNVAFSKADLEIDQELLPELQRIRSIIQQRLGWLAMIYPYTKTLTAGLIKHPVTTFLKAFVCTGVLYILYLLFKGTVAGVGGDADTHFSNVFSSDKDVRLTEELNITNVEQAGQFAIDGIALAIMTFYLIFRTPYHQVAGKIINEAYKPSLVEQLNKINESRAELENEGHDYQQHQINLKRQILVLNRLYKFLKSDLHHYGAEPDLELLIPAASIENSERSISLEN